MNQLRFSGHDTFHCRQFWLKKAVDFLNSGLSFTDDSASVDLGVGKNMVGAIRYWSKAFGILNEDDSVSFLGEKLLGRQGYDPFLEDIGSLWLLHFNIVSQKQASIYSIIFNELSSERSEFTSDFVVSYLDSLEKGHSHNTLKKDFTAFYKTYYADFDSKDIEESFTGVLTELNLVNKLSKPFVDKEGKLKTREVFSIERTHRPNLPDEIVFYAIVNSFPGKNSIDFESLYNGTSGIGNTFALSKEGFVETLERLEQIPDYGITFSNHAGVRELQIKSEYKPIEILNDYYGF